MPDPDEVNKAFEEVLRLKRDGFPIRNPDRVLDIMRHARPFRCNFGRIAIHVDHRGKVYSCEDPEGIPIHEWTDHEHFEPEVVYASDDFSRVTRSMSSCNRCRLPCVIELANNLPISLASMFLKAGTL